MDLSLSWVALHANRIVGVCLVTRERYLQYLVVHEAYQKQGIGSALLAKAKDNFDSLHCATELEAWYRARLNVISCVCDSTHLLLTIGK